VPIVLKSGSLKLLEPSGPVQACNGIALPLTFTHNRAYIYKIQNPEGYQYSYFGGLGDNTAQSGRQLPKFRKRLLTSFFRLCKVKTKNVRSGVGNIIHTDEVAFYGGRIHR
jgi:hypothetical protein